MPAMAGALLGPAFGGDPADLLTSLTAVSSSVTGLGPGTVRGVPVTGFAVKINPAKAAAKVHTPGQVGCLGSLKGFGSAVIPVKVWVDSQNQVRRELLTLRLTRPGGSGAPAGTITLTTDFYDFGVPVHVSAPPTAEIASLSQLNNGGEIAVGSGGVISSGSASGTGSFSGVSASPPPVSGALTADRAPAAEQAVAAFWSALGSNNAAAVARTVLPAQRSCVQSKLGGGAPAISVSALHITSARPAGNASATVRFTVQAKAKLSGLDIPIMLQGPGTGVEWLVATEASGRWYVNIVRSAVLFFGGTCS